MLSGPQNWTLAAAWTTSENLAEAVRQLDPAAIALFSYWPAEPDGSDPDWEPPIRRLTFEPAPEGQPGPGGTYILDENDHQLLSHTQTGGPVRYQMASFWHFGFEDVAQMLAAPVSVESPTEVAARAHRLPRWAELAADVRSANDESWDAFRAQLKEWNVD